MGPTAIPAFLLHDMGNAISVIATVARTLETLRDDLGEAEMTILADTLTRQSSALGRLLTDLADHERIATEGVSVRLEGVPLGDAVRSAVGHLAVVGVGAHVNVPDDLVVLADPDRLQQVIGNLVTNAHVHGGPSVWIDAVARGDRVVLSVSDDGPGIDPALVDRVFEPFQRGGSTHNRPGAGLGLALARDLVIAFGGELRYRRRPGGAQFVVELPAASTSPSPTGPMATGQAPFDHSAVVWADDADLVAEVAAMVADGLATGDGVLVVATPDHERAVRRRLAHLDLAGAEARGQLVTRDALATLRRFDDGTSLDPDGFEREVGGLVAQLEATHGHVRVFGEMVALQWGAGDILAALELETLWGVLYQQHDFALLCGYPTPAGGTTDAAFRPVHDHHGHVFTAPAERG